MKKTGEILGLPIISISDAVEKGKVKGVIVNAERGAVDYIIVDSGFQVIGMRVISTENVLGIGEYALTIEDEKSIIDIASVPHAIELLQKDVQVKNTKVMTKKGRLIGETGDYFVNDDDACVIAGVEFVSELTGGKVRIIPRKNIITFGKSLIVVTDDVETALVDNVSELNVGDGTPGFEKKNLANSDKQTVGETERPSVEMPLGASVDTRSSVDISANVEKQECKDSGAAGFERAGGNAEAEAEPENADAEETPAGTAAEAVAAKTAEQEGGADSGSIPESGAASLFEKRQRQYLKGRRVTKTITDSSGKVLVDEGTVITDEIIDAVKAGGKMIELVMNNKA